MRKIQKQRKPGETCVVDGIKKTQANSLRNPQGDSENIRQVNDMAFLRASRKVREKSETEHWVVGEWKTIGSE